VRPLVLSVLVLWKPDSGPARMNHGAKLTPTVVASLRDSFSDRRIAVVACLGLFSSLVIGTIAFRIAYTGRTEHIMIEWNLFLAWVPFVLALIVYDRARAGASTSALWGASVLWLLFLPNAPYLVTDLKHIDGFGGVQALYDVVLLVSAAATGLLLGLTSLFLMHSVARRMVRAFSAWAFVVGVLVLSSFGIYLGRVQRWNSWDVFVRPGYLFSEIAGGLLHPLSHPRPITVTLLFTSFLLASYVAFYSFARRASLVND
jgi:uncharacterized membrane protein